MLFDLSSKTANNLIYDQALKVIFFIMSKLLSDFIHKGIRPVVTTGKVNGATNAKPPESDSSSDEDNDYVNSNDYAKKYVQEELKLYANCIKDDVQECMTNILDVEDDGVELAASEIRSEVYRMAQEQEVYKKFNFDFMIRKDLTIHSFQDKILNIIKTNPVMVIQGPTGCGKTTQVPQYILDHCRQTNSYCNIVVTQPRKIAAITVAKRVCHERGWTLGTVCGYQVGLDKQVSRDVILTYMTTGVLLQKLIQTKNLDIYSHIIIDEIHERNQDLDFLLLIIRKLLFTKSFHTKVILMSATIEADEYAYYFRSQCKNKDVKAPIVPIETPNFFKVQKYYLDNIPLVELPEFDISKPEISPDVMKAFSFLLRAFDKLDQVNPETNQVVIGSVLVFLPGIREIEEAEKLLRETERKYILDRHKENDPSNERSRPPILWDIIPLHSSLPNDEQGKVFKNVEPFFRKVILSTNIAESSITVTDVTYVVDFCLTKVLTVDKFSKFSSLQLEWASKVNCEQRAGRTGRVANGRVYRLVPQHFYEEFMADKPVPEILRAPLENLVLHSKMLQFSEEPQAILALAIEPPDLANIDATIWHLKELGGLLKTSRGTINISDGDITFMGIVMSGLPLDVTLSKLIVLGYLFSALEETIIMAAGCSIPNIFSTPYHQRLEAYNKKLLWSDGSCSDLIALLNLYQVHRSYKREGSFKKPHDELIWCKSNQVSLRGFREWQLLIDEITARLKRYGIEESSGPTKVMLSSIEKPTILKVVISGAFYPNYFIRSAAHGQIDEREAVKTVGGRDPYRTVYFRGMSPGQPGQLYVRDIKEMLDIKDEVKIGFDDSMKIYVEFKKNNEVEPVNLNGQQYLTTIPGNISMEVYKAVKKRQLKYDFNLNILPREKAWDYLASLKKEEESEAKKNAKCHSNSQLLYDPLPSINTDLIQIVISNVIDTGHFWCQNIDRYTQDILQKINLSINRTPLKNVDPKTLNIDKVYVAKYSVDKQYYRVKIQTMLSKDKAQVLFIDYGNIEAVAKKDLCYLPQQKSDDDKQSDLGVLQVSPLAFECVLCEIQPSKVLNPRGIWSEHVNQNFNKQTEGKILYGKVYSIVDNVVHLELFKQKPTRNYNPESINHWLLQQGCADVAEESFLSKENHERRLKVQKAANPLDEAARQAVESIKSYSDFEAPMDDVKKFMTQVNLKGPISPLEMKLYGVLVNGANKNIDIEPQSVNSVLLDTEPQDPHTRMVVAASVNQAPVSNRLILRQTSIMPNIPGFPFLMALIFCPEMKPDVNDNGTQVTSILCGMGCQNRTKQPYFPAHDLVLTLDVEINEDVINTVNEIRYMMNVTLKNLNEMYEKDEKFRLEGNQRSLKKLLFQLLRLKLKSVTPIFKANCDSWKTTHDLEILKSQLQVDDAIWPLHWFIKMEEPNSKNFLIKKNIEDLKAMARQLIPVELTKCELCQVELTNLTNIRKHLIDKNHKEKEVNGLK